jgi:hypothetical protein
MMQRAGALDRASDAQLLRLYVALVSGYGSRDLEAAHAAFEEAVEWLRLAQQKQVKRRAQAEARAEAEAEAEAEAQTVRRGAAAAAVSGSAAGGTASDTPRGSSDEWGDDEWRAAERALHSVMVEAAAPHPRGLLLACTLLESLQRNSGQRLRSGCAAARTPRTRGVARACLAPKEGRGSVTAVRISMSTDYAQLISGHATAHELHVATGALTQAARSRDTSPPHTTAHSECHALCSCPSLAW